MASAPPPTTSEPQRLAARHPVFLITYHTVQAEIESDDEDALAALARELDDPGLAERDDRMDILMAHQEAIDPSEMDEGAYQEEFEGEDAAGEDEFERDYRGELTDQMPVTIFDPVALGLKEINNLAHFSVSSHKPGNGVRELLSDDLEKYWQ